MTSVIIFALILSFLVIIHELGHFLVAKCRKVDVDEFGLGYPPRVKTLFKWRETIFSLNAIPFGGFVKLDGEDGENPELSTDPIDAKKQSKRTSRSKNSPFYEKSATSRLLIILAGPIVNLIYGAFAFSIIFSVMGIPTYLNDQPRIESIMDNSPASESGIPSNVNIVGFKIDQQVYSISTISEVQEFVNQNRSKSVTMLLSGQCDGIECAEVVQEYEIYLRSADETPSDQGSMGIIFSEMFFKNYPWYQRPFRGIIYGMNQAVMLIGLILTSLGQILVDLFSGKGVGAEVAGPVGIVHQAQKHNLLSGGFLNILNFSGMLSINLAIMNLLPIPALDGGRAMFIILEKILGKKRVSKIESYANYGGYILLLSLIILITVKDVWGIFLSK